MAEKIFVELDEEIIFIAEKIKEAEGTKVILIIPDRAALLGSIVSLKLLAQEISKIGKYAVLVTTDEIGLKLAGKASFVTVPTVGEITADVWKEAKELQTSLVKARELAKEQLVRERKESVSSEDVIGKDTGSSEKREAGSNIDEEKQIIEKPKTENVVDDKKDETGPKITSTLSPQVVNIDGFEMAAGGDMAELDGVNDADKDLVLETVGEPIEEKDEKRYNNEMDSKRIPEKKGTSLAGRDMSSANFSDRSKRSGGRKKIGGGSSLGGAFGNISNSIKQFFSEGGNQPKILVGAGALLVFFFLISYFILPSGKVTIKVESQDITLKKKVIADTSISTLDVESLNIPADPLEETLDRSKEGETTGKKNVGTSATGQVTLYNLTESDVSVSTGTILESIETGLKYKTASTVTVPAKRPDDDPEYPGLFGTVDVGVSAEKFGEEYNVQTKQTYRITGFDVANLYGKNFNNLSGGTTEEKQVVSQEDYDKLKKELEKEIKDELLAKLKESAGDEREMLEDTVEYEITTEESTPKVNQEGASFTVSINMKATALSFSNEDITALSQALVETENDQQVEIEEFEYNSKVVKTEGSQIHIELSITGIVTPSIDEETIKEELKGANRGAAVDYLESREDIKEYEIKLSPGWLPSFLQHFPSSVSRIEVKIEKI